MEIYSLQIEDFERIAMSFIEELGNMVNVVTDYDEHFLVGWVSHGDYVIGYVAQVQVISPLNKSLTILTHSPTNQVIHSIS